LPHDPLPPEEPLVARLPRSSCPHPLGSLAWSLRPTKPAVVHCRLCNAEFRLQPPRFVRPPER